LEITRSKSSCPKNPPRVAKASSFGAQDSVIIDMLVKINPKARFFTLDTGRLNPETYSIMDELSKKYNITFQVMFPDAKEVEEMVTAKGINLFYDSVENRHQVLDYIKKNNVPYHKLLDKGYLSIGCEPCTRAIKPDEDLRAGCWWCESKEHKECGIHMETGA